MQRLLNWNSGTMVVCNPYHCENKTQNNNDKILMFLAAKVVALGSVVSLCPSVSSKYVSLLFSKLVCLLKRELKREGLKRELKSDLNKAIKG